MSPRKITTGSRSEVRNGLFMKRSTRSGTNAFLRSWMLGCAVMERNAIMGKEGTSINNFAMSHEGIEVNEK